MLMNCADLDDVTETALEPRVTSPVVVPTSGKFDMRCRRPRGLPTPTCWSVSQSHPHRAPHSHCVTITPHPIAKRSIVMTVSVCPRPYLWNYSPIFTDFCARYLCPWLGPPLAASRYVMYFRFMDDVILAHPSSRQLNVASQLIEVQPTCSLGLDQRRVKIPVAGQWTHGPTFRAPRSRPTSTRPQWAC